MYFYSYFYMYIFSSFSNPLGAPFYLTSHCPGRVFNDHSVPGEGPHGKRCVYEAMMKTLCQIHRVDLKTAGLENRSDPGRTSSLSPILKTKII